MQTCLTKSLIILADRLINTCLFIQYLLKENKILHVINISCMSAVFLDTLSSCLNTKRPYEYLLMGLSRLILMDCRLSAVQTCRQSAESQQQRPSTISDDLVTNFLLPLDSWPFCRWTLSPILALRLCVVSLSHGLSFKESHENIQWVCDVTFECWRRTTLHNRNTWRIRNSLVTVNVQLLNWILMTWLFLIDAAFNLSLVAQILVKWFWFNCVSQTLDICNVVRYYVRWCFTLRTL